MKKMVFSRRGNTQEILCRYVLLKKKRNIFLYVVHMTFCKFLLLLLNFSLFIYYISKAQQFANYQTQTANIRRTHIYTHTLYYSLSVENKQNQTQHSATWGSQLLATSSAINYRRNCYCCSLCQMGNKGVPLNKCRRKFVPFVLATVVIVLNDNSSLSSSQDHRRPSTLATNIHMSLNGHNMN